jgi:hypothetical protein
MAKREYFERHGKTPLDDMPAAERPAHVTGIEHAVFVRLLLEHHDGRVVISGMGDPGAVDPLMDYRIGMRGLGQGRIEIWLDSDKGT